MNLSGLQHLYAHDGPFLSLYLDVSRDTEDAAHRIETRWRTLSADLARAGADADLLEQVRDRVVSPTGIAGPATRTVVAADGEVLLDDVRAGSASWPEVSTWAPLPDVSGWVSQVEGEVPFVLVVADREGADVDVYRALSVPDSEHEEVHGETLHITKVPQGDWAQKQFQRRSEEVWRRNAESVAEVVQHACAQARPRLIALAGDVRARAEIKDALGDNQVPVADIEAGGRAAGSSDEALWDAVRAALVEVETDERMEIRNTLEASSGQGRAVARGLPNVMSALVNGQVDRLVVDLESVHEQTVAPADYPGLELPTAASTGTRMPADQVLVAAGAATDTRLSVLPANVTRGDGVAAILRWE